jgi:hypothetical protein
VTAQNYRLRIATNIDYHKRLCYREPAPGSLPGVSKPRLRALFDIVNELRRARFIAQARPWYAANRLHCEMEAAVELVLIPASNAREGRILVKRTHAAEMQHVSYEGCSPIGDTCSEDGVRAPRPG